MEDLPLEHANKIKNISFSGKIKEDDNCPTVMQFLKYVIEDSSIANDEDKKYLAIQHSTGFAKDFMESHINQNWKSFKKLLLNKFKCKLTLKEKIDLRRYLIQRQNECCEDFHERCVKWQFLLCDDHVDSVYGRDILINFVSGLKEEIYKKLVHNNNISDLELCVKLAIEIEQKLTPNIFSDAYTSYKAEIEFKDIKTEVVTHDEDTEYNNAYEYLDENIKVEENDKQLFVQTFEEENGIVDNDEDYFSTDQEDNAGSDFEPTEEDFALVKKENPIRTYATVHEGVMYECEIPGCGKQMNRKYNINKHMKKAHSAYSCDFCSKTFKTNMLLQRHLLNAHDDQNTSKNDGSEIAKKCQFCDKVLVNKLTALKRHIDINHPDKKDLVPELQPIYCDICPNKKGKNHKTNFRVDGKSTNECELSLALHKAFVHCKNDPNNSKDSKKRGTTRESRKRIRNNLLCHICNKSFSKQNLEKHIKVDHFNVKLPTCEQCGSTFTSDYLLRSHNNNGSTSKCNGICEYCGMKFKNQANKLKAHIAKVHTVKKPPLVTVFPCEKCGKIFNQKVNLQAHLLSHIEGNHVVCDMCGKGFKYEQLLKSHKETHMPKTIKCIFDNCECMFSSKPRLNAHLSRIHKKSVKNERFYCDECPKVTKTKTLLNQHIKVVHRGERPFQCPKCDYDAAYKVTLNEHIATVHEGVMFHCKVPGCGKQMNRIANINKHMKTAHGIPLPNERALPKKKQYIDDLS